jgi:hypothetical protein
MISALKFWGKKKQLGIPIPNPAVNTCAPRGAFFLASKCIIQEFPTVSIRVRFPLRYTSLICPHERLLLLLIVFPLLHLANADADADAANANEAKDEKPKPRYALRHSSSSLSSLLLSRRHRVLLVLRAVPYYILRLRCSRLLHRRPTHPTCCSATSPPGHRTKTRINIQISPQKSQSKKVI